ncbi:DUF1700 domain-containing protein [archaeon]|jgi:uncharacterized membrane protein|nr:DUF1700 domain-containing protein [archaeon]
MNNQRSREPLRGRKKFLEELKDHLIGIPAEDMKEILEDYEEHFKMGKKEKRKETEIAKSLGNPKEIAREVRIELKKDQKEIPLESRVVEIFVETKKFIKKIIKRINDEIPFIRESIKKFFNPKKRLSEKKEQKKTKEVPSKKKGRNAWKIVLLSFLDLFVFIAVFFSLLGAIFSLFISGIAISLSGLIIFSTSITMLFSTISEDLRNLFSASLFSGIGVSSFGALISLASVQVGKAFFKGVKWYFGLHKKAFGGKNE